VAQLTPDQLRQALASALAAAPQSISPEDAERYVDAAANALITSGEPPRPGLRRIDASLVGDKVFAIPDDALDLFPSVVGAVLGAFEKGPASVLPDLVSLLLRYRSLRIEISPEEAAVLRALKAAKAEGAGPLAPADIAARLESQGLRPSRDVAALLDALKARKTEKATLVQEADGRWAIGNV
jgi:hypothetical protein